MKYLKYINKHVADQNGKVFVVTGATNGIGLALTKQLVYQNGSVIMAVRNLEKARQVKEEILKELPKAKLEIIHYDQADFSSIEEFAKTIKNRKIDCLVLNAGIFHPTNNKLTADGYPLTVGTNYIGVYYLCEQLNESFINGNIKRIVMTSSLVRVFGVTRHYDKYLQQVKGKPNRTYNVSKRMNYILAANIKNRCPNLEVVLTHPGMARTNIIKADSSSFQSWFKFVGDKFMKLFGNSAEKSAICSLLSATIEKVDELNFIYPRVPFHLVGYPKISKRKVDKIKDESLEFASRKLIAS